MESILHFSRAEFFFIWTDFNTSNVYWDIKLDFILMQNSLEVRGDDITSFVWLSVCGMNHDDQPDGLMPKYTWLFLWG